MVSQEIFLTLRSLWRSKLFTFTALFVFSFGIAATATVFSVLDAIVLHPATFIDKKSVLNIQASHRNKEFDNVSPAVYDALIHRPDLFTQLAAERNALFTITGVPVPDQLFGQTVSANFFSFLDAKPLMGRLFTPNDDKPGSPSVVLLSYKAWQQILQGAPNILGRSVQIDGNPYTVIGVMPAYFVLPAPRSGSMLWTTLRLSSAELSAKNSRGLNIYARLRPGVSLGAAQQALGVLAANTIEPAHVEEGPVRLRATHLTEEADSNKTIAWLAMGMVAGLLLLGCSNLSSIMLARSVGRRKDYAIRLAAGASRWQLARQTLIEVFSLAFISLALACAVIPAALTLIRNQLTSSGAGIAALAHVQLNAASLLFAFAITLLTALLCGLFPAISNSSVDLASGLRETGAFRDNRQSSRRFLHSLLAIEAGIALLLLLTSGLLVRSLSRTISEDHGLRPDHVLTLRLPNGSWMGVSHRQTEEQLSVRRNRYLDLLRKSANLPGVQAAALSSSLPLSHVVVRTALRTPGAESKEISAVSQAVTRDYFRTMGIPILSGQTFPEGKPNHSVVLVNQAFARQYFSTQDPIGQFLPAAGGDAAPTQVIGLVKDSPNLDLTEKIEPQIYLDFEQTTLTPFLTGLVVRTKANPELMAGTLRKTLALSDAGQPVVQVKTLETLIAENIWQPRFAAWFASIFAATAACLVRCRYLWRGRLHHRRPPPRFRNPRRSGCRPHKPAHSRRPAKPCARFIRRVSRRPRLLLDQPLDRFALIQDKSVRPFECRSQRRHSDRYCTRRRNRTSHSRFAS